MEKRAREKARTAKGQRKRPAEAGRKPARTAKKTRKATVPRASQAARRGRTSGRGRQAASSLQERADRHVAGATKPEAEEFRKQLLQHMDASGYVSWSAKKRRYVIRGTSSSAVDGGLVPCPSCGVGELLVIKSPKSGKRFIGCSNFYGGCDASSPLLQKARLRATKKACKACGWPEVIFRYSSKQKWTRQCSNIACPTRSDSKRRQDMQ